MLEEKLYRDYYEGQASLLDQHEAHAHNLLRRIASALTLFGAGQLSLLERSPEGPDHRTATICNSRESSLLLKAADVVEDSEEIVIRSISQLFPLLSIIRHGKADDAHISFNYAPHSEAFSSASENSRIAQLASLGLPLISHIRDEQTIMPFFLLPRPYPEGTVPPEKEGTILDPMLLALLGPDLIMRGIKSRPHEPYSLARIWWTEEQQRVFFCVGEIPYLPEVAQGAYESASSLLSLWVSPQVGVVKQESDRKEPS